MRTKERGGRLALPWLLGLCSPERPRVAGRATSVPLPPAQRYRTTPGHIVSLARMLISAIAAIAPRAHDRQRCHPQVLYGEWGKRGGVAASGGCVADEASGRAPPRSTASE